jgi:hypothetical protein
MARQFLEVIRRAGSVRSSTPGSGAGIATSGGGLVGNGVGLGDALTHFGCQSAVEVVPMPRPLPPRNPMPME